jgi:hypothetical protein
MAREKELFFANLLETDGSILDLIQGEYTSLNERLARHCGIKGVKGPEFRRTPLAGTGRAGTVTQASVLTISSYNNRTSPVLRGKWLLENLLDAQPPPPPPDVRALDETSVGGLRVSGAANGKAPKEPGARLLPFTDGPARFRS